MSLARLGAASARRQFQESFASRGGLRQIAPSDRVDDPTPTGGLAARVETQTKTEKHLERVTQYIPAETITIFVGLVSAWQPIVDVTPVPADAKAYNLIFVFLLITPAMLALSAYATFVEGRRKDPTLSDLKFKWPIFDMIASTIAFGIWALAVPGLFEEGRAESLAILAAPLALIASYLLSKFRPIFAAGS